MVVREGPSAGAVGCRLRTHSSPMVAALVAVEGRNAVGAGEGAQEDQAAISLGVQGVPGFLMRRSHSLGNWPEAGVGSCSSNWADGSSAPPLFSAGALSPLPRK
jgi:hypothetical protein